MKRTLSLIAAAAVGCSLLSACGNAGEAAGMNSAGGSASLPITTRVFEKEYQSVDQKVLLGKYSYSLPYLSSDDVSSDIVVERFNDNTDSMLQEEVEGWEQAMEDAQNYYDRNVGSDDWRYGSHWSDEITYETCQTDTLLSIRYTHYIYTGGAHGYAYYTGQLFAVKEGYFVTIDEMTDDPEGLSQAVSDEIMRQIEDGDLAVQYSYWNDYASYIDDWMNGDYSIFFNEAGEMEIIFPAYELASYAAGPQAFSISPEVYGTYCNEYGAVLLGLS